MKRLTLAMVWTAACLGAGCRPSVGEPISLVSGPAILAMKGEPPEAAAGTQVSYEILAVDVNGRVPSVGGDISTPVLWAICEDPKPPIETNSVNTSCLDTVGLPGDVGPTPTTFSAAMPDAACQEFGPITPNPEPGQPTIRPRDADATGGYYLPVRMTLEIPEELRRKGMATEDSLMAFGLERISCGLARAPAPPILVFNRDYTLNKNPSIDALTWQQGAMDPVAATSLETGGAAMQVAQGQSVTFSLSWTPDSVETYPAWDVLSQTLIYHRESMRVAWYVTGGSFEHDVTGRTESETETFAANTWKPDGAGLFHLWVVLHDSRGGADFASFDIEAI
jgi:hypothetical protein